MRRGRTSKHNDETRMVEKQLIPANGIIQVGSSPLCLPSQLGAATLLPARRGEIIFAERTCSTSGISIGVGARFVKSPAWSELPASRSEIPPHRKLFFPYINNSGLCDQTLTGESPSPIQYARRVEIKTRARAMSPQLLRITPNILDDVWTTYEDFCVWKWL